jgi:hypothetical protein
MSEKFAFIAVVEMVVAVTNGGRGSEYVPAPLSGMGMCLHRRRVACYTHTMLALGLLFLVGLIGGLVAALRDQQP